ncbi:F-box/kelch-repeat protein At3g06240-like [Vicia villosa]|uniref:F-box/kelch-repeat protein At3g06240-like n=1 Tax=Vicia villosa TaxID=3911 RepID=UPI00273C996F|nr:F-box/kelch-repeat protein At3g06240-like [Vicia villosa]XP_058744865.1 F-box/kelch-repeat protein At3g06240-like [Vicia villosa]
MEESVAIRDNRKCFRVTVSEDWEMEEYEAIVVKSKKVRNYIPDDVSFCILSKLPLKSLKRFECACKSWSLLLQDSYFINLFSNNNNLLSVSKDYDDTYFILSYLKDEYTIPSEFYLLPGGVFKNRVKIDWPHPYQECQDPIYILGSVSINGIFCLRQHYKGGPVLWNPTTGEFKVIPPTPPPRSVPTSLTFQYGLHGFGYDSVTDDYKVLQLTNYGLLNDEYQSCWELYSLRNNSWKELHNCIPNRHYYTLARMIGVYVNGVSHWWARSESKYDLEECLISFDFINEVFFTTPAPSYLDVSPRPLSVEQAKKDIDKFLEKHLVLLNESIALISTYIETSTFHISILGELGVKESWTKLFVINHLPFICSPIGVGIKNNLVFFKRIDDKLACIDLNTKMIEEDLGVNPWHHGSQIGKYKKSSLPIGGRNV